VDFVNTWKEIQVQFLKLQKQQISNNSNFMNQITYHDFGLFETELLSVDFISLNIPRTNSQQITRLASYFQSLGFNTYQK